MGCIINMEIVAAHAFFIGEISPLPLNLVNKSVSRETSMLAANRLTQIGNERKLANGGLFWCAMLHRREAVCCLPSYPTRKASGRTEEWAKDRTADRTISERRSRQR